ncbi:MAG TPA: glycosyltransferase family 4 protein [Pyrinomonadaceae bacterium]|jgi:glycosyltransferase involved in cell wall biosynthesis|nr:glycosyltransferase family 4 protein [Pyrinomonadaceae bacterium]
MTTQKPVKTLYLCYFGLREPLVQTQVLPYLRQLIAGDGAEVFLLTFEPEQRERWTAADEADWRERLAREGIRWVALPYHKRPSVVVTPYDILCGAWTAVRLTRRHKIDVLHARGHIPALMGAIAKRVGGGRLLFDIRGFLPEEYTDAGVWPENGLIYRTVKRVERYLLKTTDGFVVLTEKARAILFDGRKETDERGRPIEVIPCCVDAERFREADAETGGGSTREDVRRELKLEGRRVFVYVGSFGGWYMTDEMTRFLAHAHREDPKTFSMILTQNKAEDVAARLRELGLEDEDFFVAKVAPADVPRYLRAADVAISFIRACYSKLSSSPTKIAEYLASGLPVICNTGVGDLDELIEGDRVGVLISDFTPEAYERALAELDALCEEEDLAERCRASARRRFDLVEVGGARYRRLYRRLMEGRQTP